MKKILLSITIATFVAGCSSVYKESIEQGNKALEEQNFNDAVSAFKVALDEKPNNEDAIKGLEKAEKEIKKIEEQKKRDEEREKEVEARKKVEANFLNSIDKSTIIGNAKFITYQVFKDGYSDPEKIVQNVEFYESDKSLMITVKGKDGWSEKSMGKGFYIDSTAVYQELSKDNRLNEVWITVTFPMQDTYGNIENEEVMSTWMSRETMDKINWGNFDYKKLLDVVDGKRIYPQFVQ